jgi:hypothetical protein
MTAEGTASDLGDNVEGKKRNVHPGNLKRFQVVVPPVRFGILKENGIPVHLDVSHLERIDVILKRFIVLWNIVPN